MRLKLTDDEAKSFSIAVMNTLEHKDYRIHGENTLSHTLRTKLSVLDQQRILTHDEERICIRAFSFFFARLSSDQQRSFRSIAEKISALGD